MAEPSAVAEKATTDVPSAKDIARAEKFTRERFVHPGEEEVIYVISGEGTQTVGEDGEPFAIREGDAIYIPKNTLHSTYNTTWRPLRLVVVYTPGGAETGLDTLPDATLLEPGVASRWSQSN